MSLPKKVRVEYADWQRLQERVRALQTIVDAQAQRLMEAANAEVSPVVLGAVMQLQEELRRVTEERDALLAREQEQRTGLRLQQAFAAPDTKLNERDAALAELIGVGGDRAS